MNVLKWIKGFFDNCLFLLMCIVVMAITKLREGIVIVGRKVLNFLASVYGKSVSVVKKLLSVLFSVLFLFGASQSSSAQTFREFDRAVIKDLSRAKLELSANELIDRGISLESNLDVALKDLAIKENEKRDLEIQVMKSRNQLHVCLAIGVGTAVGAGLACLFLRSRW